MNEIVQTVNPRAKRLSLRVDQKAGVIRLTVPKWTMQRTIDRFLSKQADWIKDKQKHLLPKINITDGAVIPFTGTDHVIRIQKHTKRTTDIEITDSSILITTSRDDPSSNLKRWIIEYAREIITPLANEKASQINKTISKIDLRDPSSRWGSCSTDKRLMFSWRVIMAPPYVLDYLVAHEVAHLKHMDHSQKFWDTCYDLCDRPDEGRAWLKNHGNDLMRWF